MNDSIPGNVSFLHLLVSHLLLTKLKLKEEPRNDLEVTCR